MSSTSHEKQVKITGYGGQGIVLTGNILGKAAAIHDNMQATMTQSYGPEARGGACSSQVIISDQEILFPEVEHPQVLICMSEEGYRKNIGDLAKNGILIWDSDLVEIEEPDPTWTTYDVPATRIAEELGNKMMANIVMLGFVSAVSDLVSADSLRQAVLSSVPPHTKEKNAGAFDRGKEYGEAILKSRSKKEESREHA
ncbi:MAG: 2-oxoacid:acceptor oxidoreductase family protein [bacterium]